MIKIMIMIRQGLLLWHDNDDDWIAGLLFVVCPAHVVPRRSATHAINVTLTIINLVIIINAIPSSSTSSLSSLWSPCNGDNGIWRKHGEVWKKHHNVGVNMGQKPIWKECPDHRNLCVY